MNIVLFVNASLAAVESDLQVMRVRLEQTQLRSQQTYEQQRLSYLQRTGALNVVRVNLKLAEVQHRIQEALYTNKPPLTTLEAYQIASYAKEALEVEVRETLAFLKESERILPKLLADTANVLAALEADIGAQQATILASTTNLILRGTDGRRIIAC